MGSYFWIAVGSALGGMARFWLSGFVANRIGETFPFGTLKPARCGITGSTWTCISCRSSAAARSSPS